jgi:hypothetical protein
VQVPADFPTRFIRTHNRTAAHLFSQRRIRRPR